MDIEPIAKLLVVKTQAKTRTRMPCPAALILGPIEYGRACARRALHLYLAAVGLGDLAGYGQPQARAATGAGGISPVEALEDEGQLFLLDTDARIRNFKRDLDAVLPHTYRDVPALGLVAHGVVQEYGGSLEGTVPIEGGLDLSFQEDAFDRHLSVVGVPGCLRRFLGDCS